MNVDDRQKNAFAFTADLTKQLITLSTGIVTITLLLSKDLVGPRLLAAFAWTFFLISALCGLWVLMALTGTLAPLESEDSNPKNGGTPAEPVDEPQDAPLKVGNNVRLPSKLQVGAFGLAIVLTVIYVFFAAASKAPAVDRPALSCTCCAQH